METLKKCTELLEKGENIALVTVIKADYSTPGKPGFKLVLTENGEQYGTVGGGALEDFAVTQAKEVLASGENIVVESNLSELGMKCGGRVTFTVEYMSGTAFFVIYGGGHVSQALAPLLEGLGFKVVIFDDRPDILQMHSGNAQRTIIHGSFDDIGQSFNHLSSGLAFITTHEHAHDTTVLRQLLASGKKFTYLGMIGSKRKIQTAFDELNGEGITIPDFVYAPVGLDIGGSTVYEIAVSVASEILTVKYGKPAYHMRDKIKEQKDRQ